MGPIFSKPFQLIMIYPIMTPNKPYRHVEAPALMVVVLHRAEKILPTMAVTR